MRQFGSTSESYRNKVFVTDLTHDTFHFSTDAGNWTCHQGLQLGGRR